MDLIFWSEKSFWKGLVRKVGIAVMIYENMFVIEITDSGLELRNLGSLTIDDIRRSWIYDSTNTLYTAQAIVVNDIYKELASDKSSQYNISKVMAKSSIAGQYIYTLSMLSGMSMRDDYIKRGIKHEDLLTDRFGYSKVFFKEIQ